LLTLQTAEADIAANDVLGKISFQAPNEGTGTDAILIAAAIQAISEGDFSSSSNATSLEFMTGASEAATSKLSITSGGNIVIPSTGGTLSTTTAGTSNLRLGVNAGNSIASGGNYNVTVGDEAGTAITTGDANTLVGYQAGLVSATGGRLTAIGYQAGKSQVATSGSQNVFVGNESGFTNTTGATNTFVGGSSGGANTTGSNNVAVGQAALDANTTASANTAVGVDALGANTTGSNNTAVGALALDNNTTGTNNVAIGRQALDANTTSSQSVAIGFQAGKTQTTVGANTFVGNDAGRDVTGQQNAFYGHDSGRLVTSGDKNTIIGSYDGNESSLDIRTSDNNIVLSDGDGNPRGFYKGQWVFNSDSASVNAMILRNTSGTAPYLLNMSFTGATPNNTTSEFLACGDPSVFRLKIFSNGNVVNSNNSYGAISDVKLKENIVDASSQWDDVKALTVRKYSMKADNLDAPNMLGVIAQEVESAGMGGLVFESPDRDTDNNDLGTVTKQVNYSILYIKAVKALQEAMARIETLETKVTALEG